MRFRKSMMVGLAMLLLVLSACSKGNNASSGSNGGDNSSPIASVVASESPKNEQPKEEVTLTIWTFHDSSDPNNAMGKLFGNIGAEYEKAFPDRKVKIKHSYVPFGDYIGAKMRTAFASNTGPDLFLACPPCIVENGRSGNMVDFHEYLTDEQFNDFFPGPQEGWSMDGKFFALPYAQAFEMLWYDKDIFKSKSMAPPQNWNELKDAGLKLKEGNKPGLVNYMIADNHISMPYSPFIWSNGADYLSDDGTKATLNTPEMIESLSYIRSLMTEKIQAPKTSQPATEVDIIAKKETPMQILGSWGIGNINSKYKDRNLGVVPVPAPEGKEPVLTMGGWGIAVNAKNKHVKEAVEFAKWLVVENDEMALNLANTDGSLPTRKSITETDAFKIKFSGNLWAEALPMAKYTRPELRGLPEATKVVVDMLDETLNSTKRPIEEMVNDYNDRLQKIVDEHPDTKVIF